ncbi:Hypothetical predicted protein [Olea europaea subsp. europaea]|uniref:Ubiquitin-like protease family profile domain-containing protein n=1 Tax=Olea europaea subsp. europaea TaxID=158383 RepID=A0A8S0PN24_OLEEU|nr:Hypothetical predicted protein [Olea europaea subsp. europaea]
MLVAFQAWIYETFPGLDEVIVTKISTTHPRIKNWFANEQPSASKLEEPDCFKKPNIMVHYRRKNRKRKSANPASMSGESVPLVTDIGVGHAHVADGDDAFMDPPRRCEVTSHQETSNAAEGPSAPQHSPNEPQYHGTERSDQTKKINEIMKMQEQIKCDMTEIRTNMQFLSESVTAMISSTMDEILRLFNDRKGSPVKEFGDTEPAVVGGEESHVVEEVHKIDEVGNQEPVVDRKGKGKVDPSDDATFECSLQPPSFDLGFGYTQLDVSHSAEIQKRVDAVISDVVTASANVEEEESPTSEPPSELPMKRVSRPARILCSPFVAGAGKKKFNEHDDVIKPAFVIGSYPVGNKTWFHQLVDPETSLNSGVLKGVEPYVKILLALMNALEISKKDPDYNGSGCMELKVTVDTAIPQQMNGHDCRVFVILYALYILRDGRCSIPQKFDVAKCRLDIASLLYKHRETYVKNSRQATKGEGIVIE